MKFAVLGYNFPHWKTQNGLFNLFVNGFKPDIVILQNKKQLNVPVSQYRVTPEGEYLQEPKEICRAFKMRYKVLDHDSIVNFCTDFAVILGARILKKRTIRQFSHGILNIHPGILPGNRGLDNLKWSLIKHLPVGVTAHFIDERIDMGKIVKTATITQQPGETIRELYLRQRSLEQSVLIDCFKQFALHGIDYKKYQDVQFSEKFGVVPAEIDNPFLYTCANKLNIAV